MMVLDPILGVSLGVVLYGEAFSTGVLAWVQGAGLALTLSAVWLLAHGEKRDTARPDGSLAIGDDAGDASRVVLPSAVRRAT
jgi:hypothetical protein